MPSVPVGSPALGPATCDQGHVLGEGPHRLTIVVADRPRSHWHEGPAWALAATRIGVECSVSIAECRCGIVYGELNEWNERRPIRLATIDKAAKHACNYSMIDTLSAP
jgi:hypothetical protein